MNKLAGAQTYLLGHTDEELARLARQAEMFSEPTEDLLRRAGIGPGMTVLDIGCGVGDVSLTAAAMVGPTGRVVGIDRSEHALATARLRSAAAGLPWLSFEERDLHDFAPAAPFDAVIGRFILMHLADPARSLAGLLAHLAPGGIAAFMEMDIDSAATQPRLPAFDAKLGLIPALYERAGIETQMGTKLYGTFRAAGLAPRLSGSCRVEGAADSVAYEYLADSLRSLLPSLEHFAIATAAELDIDTIVDRMRAEAVAADVCFIFPRVIGAWARKAG